ncbi:hypothetical protein GOODEAATRI_032265 [Goodea atripinnis]|uniref:Uncharacterized protein n=1 Tax=Goodea atripinnis TaxID=208336 RepID=A0ABV0NPV4_9TELE
MNENTGYTDSISFYLTLHMIDDRMALDPVEFMSFCQQKTFARWASPEPSSSEAVWKEKDLWKGGGLYAGSPLLPPLSPSELCFYLGNGATGSPQLSPFLAVPEEG